MLTLGLALAVLIGLALGLLGGGGSVLTVPVLVYVNGFEAKTAIAMSLPVVGVTSLVGAALHWRHGNVQLRTALGFGAIAMMGAYAGARLASLFTASAQLSLLAITMIVAALSMLRTRSNDRPSSAPPRLILLLPIAFAIGILTGLVGIGGGFLVVPALVLLARVPMRVAVGTSLVVIALNAASGFVGYLGSVDLDWAFLAGFSAAACVGALVGSLLAVRVPQAALKRGFAVFLLLVGGFVLYRSRDAHAGNVTVSRAAPR
jgi:uncharacterized membrane protein YfcA